MRLLRLCKVISLVGSIRPNSCVAAAYSADNTAVPKGITEDLEGNPRFVDDPDTKDTGNGDPPIVDMGAYEFQACPADLDRSGAVDIGDLIAVLAAWGPCNGCVEDLDGSGDVEIGDLIAVLLAWGPCP